MVSEFEKKRLKAFSRGKAGGGPLCHLEGENAPFHESSSFLEFLLTQSQEPSCQVA